MTRKPIVVAFFCLGSSIGCIKETPQVETVLAPPVRPELDMIGIDCPYVEDSSIFACPGTLAMFDGRSECLPWSPGEREPSYEYLSEDGGLWFHGKPIVRTDAGYTVAGNPFTGKWRPDPPVSSFSLANILQEMVLGSEYQTSCREIFADPAFSEALSQVPVHDAGGSTETEPWRVRFRAAITAGHGFQHCDKDQQVMVAGTKYRRLGWTDLSSRTIVIYPRACQSVALYGSPTAWLSRVGRVLLILGHEVGHEIHMVSGQYKDDFEEERFATWFGTFFAECFSRYTAKKIEQPVLDDPTTREWYQFGGATLPDGGRFASCLAQRHLVAAEQLAKLRRRGPKAFDVGTVRSMGSCLEPFDGN